jgi:dihydrofolate reductase
MVRKLSLYMITTLDGLIAGDNGEFDDYEPSAEEMAFANQLFGAAGGIVFGRVIYEIFAYWDTLDLADPTVSQADREFAANFRRLPRVVFSRTLNHVDDQAIVINDDIAAAITRLKQQPGGDLLLICGPELLATLVALGLVDEYRLLIRPTALGHGKALFGALPAKLQLKLAATRVFESGVVMQHYQPA